MNAYGEEKQNLLMRLNLKKKTLIKLVGSSVFLSENKGSDWKMFDLFIRVRMLN